MVTLQPFLDEQWRVAIEAQIEALPETLADVADPYTVGVEDAEHGRPCEPNRHYAKLGEIAMYEDGWRDATEAINAALDLREDMDDREWHARGMW